MSDSKVLIVGSGPVAHFYAARLCALGQPADKWVGPSGPVATHFQLEALQPKVQSWCGQFHWGRQVQRIEQPYSFVILATPAHLYGEAAQRLGPLPQACWFLPSATPGSHRRLGARSLIACSSFVAACKGTSPHFGLRAVKQRVYVHRHPKLESVLDWHPGIQLEVLDHPLAAEARNITSYVHPALFLNEVALDWILRPEWSKKYLYKLFPEGPLSRQTLSTMLDLHQEIGQLLGSPFNLLKFLNDDNYPVLPQTLSRREIEDFPQFSRLEQEFLLYVRYTSLLIDPFSEPDPLSGRYHDFSAVPMPFCQDGQIPRIPLEDYRTLLFLQALASRQALPIPTIEGLCQGFVESVQSRDWLPPLPWQKYREEAEALCSTHSPPME